MPSPAGRTGGVDPQRIERPAFHHEQAAPSVAAEADIGAALGQLDVPDRHQYAVRALTPAQPFFKARTSKPPQKNSKYNRRLVVRVTGIW